MQTRLDVLPGLPGPGVPGDTAVAAAIDRLDTEFAGRIRRRRIARTVLLARHDLAGSPAPALPELVERLARERLRQATGVPGSPG